MNLKSAYNVIKDEIVHGDLPLQVGLRFEDYSDLHVMKKILIII